MSHKPIIRYSDTAVPPVVGGRAIIRLAEAHHRPDLAARQEAYGNIVTTSRVVTVASDGSFETLNTLYVPDVRPNEWDDTESYGPSA